MQIQLRPQSFILSSFLDLQRNATKSYSPRSLFWVTMLCSLIGGCQRSRGIRCPHLRCPGTSLHGALTLKCQTRILCLNGPHPFFNSPLSFVSVLCKASVKLSLYRPGQALRALGGAGSQVVMLSALLIGRLSPSGNTCGAHFCQRLSRPQAHNEEGLSQYPHRESNPRLSGLIA
jgi:hypothetical protein